MTERTVQSIQKLLGTGRDDCNDDAEYLLETETPEKKSTSLIKNIDCPLYSIQELFSYTKKKLLRSSDMQVPQEIIFRIQNQPQRLCGDYEPLHSFSENEGVSNYLSAFRYSSQIGIVPHDQCNAAQFCIDHSGTSPPDDDKPEFATASYNDAHNHVDRSNNMDVPNQDSNSLVNCSGLSQQSGQIPSNDLSVSSKSERTDHNCSGETVTISFPSEATVGSETNIAQNFMMTSSPVHQNYRKKQSQHYTHNYQDHFLTKSKGQRDLSPSKLEDRILYLFDFQTNHQPSRRYKHRAKGQKKSIKKEVPVLVAHLEKLGIPATKQKLGSRSKNKKKTTRKNFDSFHDDNLLMNLEKLGSSTANYNIVTPSQTEKATTEKHFDYLYHDKLPTHLENIGFSTTKNNTAAPSKTEKRSTIKYLESFQNDKLTMRLEKLGLSANKYKSVAPSKTGKHFDSFRDDKLFLSKTS